MKKKPMETIPLEMKEKPEEDYEADHALEHITKAHEMMGNEELMERVHARAGRKMKALSGLFDKPKIKSIADLKAYRNKKAKEEV